jgi:glycosyltransferase involved in cell wall biosynthesis
MRVCLVSSSFYPATFYGGPISATWDLSKKLAQRGFEVYVSTTDANGRERLEVKCNTYLEKEENVFVKYYNEQIINRLSLSFIFGIWSDIKKSDVVYIQYLFHYTVFFSLLLSVMQCKKVIICPRGSFSKFTLTNRFSFLKSLWIFLFIRPFSRRIIWQASSYLEESDIRIEFPNSTVSVINDGVNFQSFQVCQEISKTELVNRYSNSSFTKVSSLFFSMGRLHKIKRFDILIDAFYLFLQEDKNAKLIIAGGNDGSGSKLNNQIKRLNIEDSVFLIGAIGFGEKKILLNNCDYFTLASEFESFGIVVAEALSCGLPVVVSNKTPWRDIEINNCGIFSKNDKVSFFQAFQRVQKIKYNKEQIKKYVRKNYDWEIIAQKFINCIKTN